MHSKSGNFAPRIQSGPFIRLGLGALAATAMFAWCTDLAAAPPPSKTVQPAAHSGCSSTAGAEPSKKADGCCAAHGKSATDEDKAKTGGCCAEKAKAEGGASATKSSGCGGCSGKGHAATPASQTKDGGCGGHSEPTVVAAPPAKSAGCSGTTVTPAEAAAINKVQQDPAGAAGDSTGSPKMVAKNTTAKAEPVWRGQPLKFDFEIRNEGTADLMLWPKGG